MADHSNVGVDERDPADALKVVNEGAGEGVAAVGERLVSQGAGRAGSQKACTDMDASKAARCRHLHAGVRQEMRRCSRRKRSGTS